MTPDTVSGLRADLWRQGYRPVAVCSADSKDASPGKRPVGLDWTTRARQNPPEAAVRRAGVHALNTGILCDGLRAIDVDFDGGEAVELQCLIEFLFGDTVVRTRSNSGRCLLLYRAAEGTPPKRVLAAANGKIEVLGLGQQFVAFGRHASGADLEWPAGSPRNRPVADLPVVTEAQIDTLFAQALDIVGPAKVSGATEAHAAAAAGLEGDPEDIAAAVAVLPNDGPASWDEWSRVGLAIWGATSGSEDGFDLFDQWSSRNEAYDPEACRERWDHWAKSPPSRIGAGTLIHMAREASPGWTRPSAAAEAAATAGDEFEAVEAPWTEGLLLTKDDTPRACGANALQALRGHPIFRGVFAYNEFSHRIMIMAPPPWRGPPTPREINDADPILCSEWLQRAGIMVSDEQASKAMVAVARERGFHPVRQYLDGLVWDGVARLDTWLIDHLGAADDAYTRAVAAKTLIAAVARIQKPGCQVDTILTLEGPQGMRKSTAIETLCGKAWFMDRLPDITTKEALETMQGRWIVEQAELATYRRGGDVDSFKAFVTTRTDRFRPSYGRYPADHDRQCIFVASVNPGGTGYLKDDTGNRRFWPVKCAVGWAPGQQVDSTAFAAVRDQLWAEAVVRYRAGEKWWLDTRALEEAQAEQADDRLERDAWTGAIEEIIAGRPFVRTDEIMGHPALDLAMKDRNHLTQRRVASVLQTLGWASKTRRLDRKPTRVFVPPHGAGGSELIQLDEFRADYGLPIGA
jgi:predicted P-loop ATPase